MKDSEHSLKNNLLQKVKESVLGKVESSESELDSIIDMIKRPKKEESIDKNLISRYILYAREVIKPRLLSDSRKVLEEFFIKELLPRGDTLRALESLIKLSMSRAKMFLRDTILLEDVESVIRLYRTTLICKGKSKKVSYSFIDMLKSTGEKEFFEEDLKKLHEESNCNKSFDRIIGQMNESGILIKKAKKLYRLVL